MKALIGCCLLVVFNFTQLVGQMKWTLLTTQTTATSMDAITLNNTWFKDTQTGFAVGSQLSSGLILRTTDGGATWKEALKSSSFDRFTNIRSVGNGVLWASGSKGTASGLLLYKSTDEGTTWSAKNFPESYAVHGICFSDMNTGWIAINKSANGKVYKTTDGGSSWSMVFNGQTSDGWTIKEIWCMQFVDAQKGWAAGNNGFVIHTSDGGTTWSKQTSNTNASLFGLRFLNATTGWVVGGGGTVIATTNGGTTWTRSSLSIFEDFRSVTFKDAKHGWAAGGRSGGNLGIMYSTTDAGATWTKDSLASNRDLMGLFFLDGTTGWAVGYYGTVYKYHASTTAVKHETVVPERMQLSQNYPNPFNPTTNFQISISRHAVVVLKVFNVIGKEIVTLLDQEIPAGQYNVHWNAAGQQSGIYFATLRTGSLTQTRKVILMK